MKQTVAPMMQRPGGDSVPPSFLTLTLGNDL